MRLFWGCYDFFWFSLSCAVNWVKIGLLKTVPTVSFAITLTHFHAKVKMDKSDMFGTLETTRKLDRVNFCKDFWDCYEGQGKNWPIAVEHVPSNDPRINCGTHFGSSSLLVSEVANDHFSPHVANDHLSRPMWRTIICHPMWRTIISRPMSGHPRRSWNSGFDFHAVDSAFHLLDSGFLSVVLVEFRIPIVSDAGFRISLSWITNFKAQDSGFHQQKFPVFQNPVTPYMLWWIQGRGRGTRAPPLSFRPNGGPKGSKKFFLSPPPFSQGLDDRDPLLSEVLDPPLLWGDISKSSVWSYLIHRKPTEPLFTFSLSTRVMFVNMLIFVISVSTLN